MPVSTVMHAVRENPGDGAQRVLPHVGDEFAVPWLLLLVAAVALAKVARRRFRVLPAAEAAANGVAPAPRFSERQVLGAALAVCAALCAWRVHHDFAAREPNLFTVLGVGGNTNNTRLIRKAYVGDGPDFSSPERNAARTFAFKILSDSHRRYAYERYGEPGAGDDGYAQPDFFAALSFYAWWGIAVFVVAGLRRPTARAVTWCGWCLFAVLAVDFSVFVGWWTLRGVLGLPYLNSVRRLHRWGWARAACACTFENVLRLRHCVFPAVACFASFAAGFLWDDKAGERQETLTHLRAMTHASAGTMVAIGGMVGQLVSQQEGKGATPCRAAELAPQNKQCVCLSCLVDGWNESAERAKALAAGREYRPPAAEPQDAAEAKKND